VRDLVVAVAAVVRETLATTLDHGPLGQPAAFFYSGLTRPEGWCLILVSAAGKGTTVDKSITQERNS
jgi:hypothetical protein